MRPDIFAAVQLIAPGKDLVSINKMKLLEKFIAFLNETIEQGLDYVPVNLQTVRLVLLSNSSFVNVCGLKIQLGYHILMVYDAVNFSVLHYGSNRCRSLAHSVMAAELFALVLCYDHAYFIRDLVGEITGIKITSGCTRRQ